MFKSCVLHIGTEKTGTTSIQHFLLKNRQRLQEQGCFFPQTLGFPSQIKLAIYAGRKSKLGSLTAGISANLIEPLRITISEQFHAEVNTVSGSHTLLLSSEHLHSRLRNRDDIYVLKKFLSSFSNEITILVYLRRQDRVAVSLASTYYKAGHAEPWKLPRCKPTLPYYYDYKRLLDNYSDVFGVENCNVRVFESSLFENGDLVDDYCKQSGIILSPDFEREHEENQSLSLFGQRLLAELNKHMPRGSEKGLDRSRKTLVSVISEHYSGRPPLFLRAQAKAFFEHFNAGNAEIRDRFLPNLGRVTLFDEEFSAYPEESISEHYTFEQACEAAASLWKWQSERMHFLQMRIQQQAETLHLLKKRMAKRVLDSKLSS